MSRGGEERERARAAGELAEELTGSEAGWDMGANSPSVDEFVAALREAQGCSEAEAEAALYRAERTGKVSVGWSVGRVRVVAAVEAA